MPRLITKIHRGKEAIERQLERLYEQRSNLIAKYIKWEPEKKRYMFISMNVDSFYRELKKTEEEREDLKAALEAINRVGRRLHKTGEDICELPTSCCPDMNHIGDGDKVTTHYVYEHNKGEIKHLPDCNYPFCIGECVKES